MATLSDLLQTALRQHQAGQLVEAERLYRAILATHPQQSDAWHLLGVIAFQGGQLDIAAERIQQAIALNSEAAPFHNNLGNVWKAQGNLDAAIASYRQAIQLQPYFAGALNNLGVALQEHSGDFESALACYAAALQQQPNFAEALNNQGTVLRRLGRLDEAIASYERAVLLRPDYFDALNNLGVAWTAKGSLDEAHHALGRALQLRPNSAKTLISLGNVFKDQGRIADALAHFHRAWEVEPHNADAQDNYLYTLVFSPDHDAAAIYAEHQRWVDLVTRSVSEGERSTDPRFHALPKQNVDVRPPSLTLRVTSADVNIRRLRIGYVSPDFRSHAESFFTVPLFENHDHDQFEIFAYSDVTEPDIVTERLRASTDHWIETAALTDQQLAQRIRDDRIDVLVDLTLHMAKNRLRMFALKPAPVQVCWLAYQGTTGLPQMDFRLSDPHLDPPGMFDEFYSERTIRLPETFWCYDPLIDSSPSLTRRVSEGEYCNDLQNQSISECPPSLTLPVSERAADPRGLVSDLPALRNGFVTFGSLNAFCKVNPPLLRLWASVLRAVPNSRLMLLAPEGSHRETTLSLFETECVARERIVLVNKRPRAEYLAYFHDIDISLDTLPYGGQTTSLDSFWMGVPVISMLGNTAVGRAGASQLQNLGLPELIAESPEQFVAIAVALAKAPQRLIDLRSSLRQRLLNSPLMDGPRFTCRVEEAFRQMDILSRATDC